jgi:mutator protein MutT
VVIEVAGAAIIREGRLLAARRAYPSGLAGRWELPGGKARPGEPAIVAVAREITEELGCAIEVLDTLSGSSLIENTHELRIHLARIVDGEPVPREHDMIRWLSPEELDELDWLPSDRPFLSELRTRLAEGEPLPGGNVGGAVRIGPTVRRPTGHWTPAVHALLTHLHLRGLRAVPQLLGQDDSGREVLTYLPGRVLDVDRETASDQTLVEAMRWLRAYHDAVSDFWHPGPWRTSPGVSRVDQAGVGTDVSRRADHMDSPVQLIAHHDFAPYNVALTTSATGEQVSGVFDWDMAGPGTPLQDLGFAAWNWVPLWRSGSPTDAARRLQVMAAAYAAAGDEAPRPPPGEMAQARADQPAQPPVSAELILSHVVPRIERSLRVIRAGQEAGDPGMLNLGTVGEPARTEQALAGLAARLPDIRSELRRSSTQPHREE